MQRAPRDSCASEELQGLVWRRARPVPLAWLCGRLLSKVPDCIWGAYYTNYQMCGFTGSSEVESDRTAWARVLVLLTAHSPSEPEGEEEKEEEDDWEEEDD